MQVVKDLVALILVIFLLIVLDRLLAQNGIAPSGSVFKWIRNIATYVWNTVVDFFKENKDILPKMPDAATGSAIKSIF